MKRPARILGVIGIASMIISPAASTADPKGLRQITGAELEALIVSSTIQYGRPPIKGGNFSVFRDDFKYEFVTSEPWGSISQYKVEKDKVVVQTRPEFYIKVFDDNNKQQYIFVSDQAYAGYQPVVIRHLQPGERL